MDLRKALPLSTAPNPWNNLVNLTKIGTSQATSATDFDRLRRGESMWGDQFEVTPGGN